MSASAGLWCATAGGAPSLTAVTPAFAQHPNILKLWVPAEELDEFNQHIVGLIEVVHEFWPGSRTGVRDRRGLVLNGR
ncbi:hypothetical protein [Micromonospora musae]|uniref:hypothetical protein n=1 Tax=Micromonospora musae TaxID=1894970 RepID=UPI0033CE114A